MNEIEKKTRAAALREDLRNGRNGTSDESGETVDGTSTPPGGIESNDDSTFGAIVQNAGNESRGFTPTGGAITRGNQRDRNNGRSSKREPRRSGRRDRRSEKDNGGVATDSAIAEERTSTRQQRGIGRLVTNVEIDEPSFTPDEPQSTFERRDNGPILTESSYTKEDYTKINPFGRGIAYALKTNKKQRISPEEFDALPSSRGAHQSTKQEEPPAQRFYKGNVLSKQEAEDLYEPLIAALPDAFGYMDKFLWKIRPQLDERPVWSNTTDKEDKAIAKLLLKRGQKHAGTAELVRAVIDYADDITAGLALAPRMLETMQIGVEVVEDWRKSPTKKKFSLFRTVVNSEN